VAFDPVGLEVDRPSISPWTVVLVIFDVASRNGRCCMLQHFKRSSFNSKFIQLRRQGHCGFKARSAGHWQPGVVLTFAQHGRATTRYRELEQTALIALAPAASFEIEELCLWLCKQMVCERSKHEQVQ